jgi:phage FluMu protein Com
MKEERCKKWITDKHGNSRQCDHRLCDVEGRKVYIKCPKCGGFHEVNLNDSK